MDAGPLNEDELTFVYNWVDQFSLSRPKKSINRDFADGVLVAEIMAHYFKKEVDIHNYITSSSAVQKLANWNTLNAKIFKKINFQVSKNDIEHIITATPDAIQRVLKVLHTKIQAHLNKPKQQSVSNSNISISRHKQQFKSNNKEVNSFMNSKDQTIKELKQTIKILQLKVNKMDELLKVKDNKIQTLINKIKQAGIS